MPELIAAMVVLAVAAFFIGFWKGWRMAAEQRECDWPNKECRVAYEPEWRKKA